MLDWINGVVIGMAKFGKNVGIHSLRPCEIHMGQILRRVFVATRALTHYANVQVESRYPKF